jgi:hypothetical protein
MAVAAPQVMAQRVTRMALSGNLPSARNRKEFDLMSTEKLAAIQESWLAMVWHTALAQQQFTREMLCSAVALGFGNPWQAMSLLGPGLTRAGLNVLGHGMEPMHRRTMANARRLRNTPLK